MARQALLPLGAVGRRLLVADRDHIYVLPDIPLEIDLVTHEEALRSALAMEAGDKRDATLSTALCHDAILLNEEMYSDWALRPRERLELLRQRARTELARDRTRGYGCSQFEAVVEAWENCLAHDGASEEAAGALMTAYAARGQQQLVVGAYRRCRESLRELGLEPSFATEKAYRLATETAARSVPTWEQEILQLVSTGPGAVRPLTVASHREVAGFSVSRTSDPVTAVGAARSLDATTPLLTSA